MADLVPINYMRVYDTCDHMKAEPNPGGLAWVIDASKDETVDSGAALYYWHGNKWVKKYEMEMMDRPTKTLSNFQTIKKFSEQNNQLLYDGELVARASDIGSVVYEIAPPIIADAVETSVGAVVTSLVESALSSIITTINTNIDNSADTVRGEFAVADTGVLSTANSNIATAKTEVLNAVVKSASNSNSIAATLNAETRDLQMSIRVSAATGNQLSVSEAGAFVAKELPSDPTNNDIVVFNGTSWIKMQLSSIPSTLGWTTV